MPSENGDNGRNARGQFVKGNPGGNGNPHAVKTARFRAALLEAVTEDDVQAVVRMLVQKARDGNLQAAQQLFDRILGKAKVTLEVQERPPDEDPFAVLRDEEVTGALDRALARLSAGGSVAEPGGARN